MVNLPKTGHIHRLFLLHNQLEHLVVAHSTLVLAHFGKGYRYFLEKRITFLRLVMVVVA